MAHHVVVALAMGALTRGTPMHGVRLAYSTTPRARSAPSAAPRAHVLAMSDISSDISPFDQAQWEALREQQEEFWKGLWTTHAPDGEVLDELEADSAWVKTKGDQIIQVNTYFIGSVRANCDTCQDSVTAKQVQVGTYAPGQMPGVRLAGAGVAFGPRVTKRGAMTAEVGLRDGISRVRVSFVYDPQYGPAGGPPTSLELARMTVVRECLDRPPLRDEPREASGTRPSGTAADFWRPATDAPLLGLWEGERATYSRGEDGTAFVTTEAVAPTHLRACRCSGGGAGAEAADSATRLALRGGITIECPRQILPAESNALCLSWVPDGAVPLLRRAMLEVTALGRVVTENDEEVVMSPPVCDSLVVEELRQRAPAL